MMRLVTSSDIEIETRQQKRRADAVGLMSLRTLIIKSTLNSFTRDLEVMMAPTSAQAVRGQGLQKGVQRARWSTQLGTGIEVKQASSAHLCVAKMLSASEMSAPTCICLLKKGAGSYRTCVVRIHRISRAQASQGVLRRQGRTHDNAGRTASNEPSGGMPSRNSSTCAH